MTEINNLLNEGNIEFPYILCLYCRRSEFILFRELRITSGFKPSAEFHCSACRNEFIITVSLTIIEKQITKEILVINPDEGYE